MLYFREDNLTMCSYTRDKWGHACNIDRHLASSAAFHAEGALQGRVLLQEEGMLMAEHDELSGRLSHTTAVLADHRCAGRRLLHVLRRACAWQ